MSTTQQGARKGQIGPAKKISLKKTTLDESQPASSLQKAQLTEMKIVVVSQQRVSEQNRRLSPLYLQSTPSSFIFFSFKEKIKWRTNESSPKKPIESVDLFCILLFFFFFVFDFSNQLTIHFVSSPFLFLTLDRSCTVTEQQSTSLFLSLSLSVVHFLQFL